MRPSSVKKLRMAEGKEETAKQVLPRLLIQSVCNEELSTEERNAVQQLMSSALRRATRD